MTVGTIDGPETGAISSIGVPFETWSDSMGIDVDNGAVFWMDPEAPTFNRLTIVAQLTTRTGRSWTANMGMQGKSQGGVHDWEVSTVEFTNGRH